MSGERPREDATQIERLVKPFQEFARLEASGGILLIGCTVAALIWANSPWAGSYFHLWHTELTFGLLDGLLAKAFAFLDQRWADGVVLPARRVGDQAGDAGR